jgi:hypothetical protein
MTIGKPDILGDEETTIVMKRSSCTQRKCKSDKSCNTYETNWRGSMSKAWKMVLRTVVIILIVVVIGVVGPMVLRGHLTALSSELNFAALLATLVGGIMAAAGLVVALVSVVSFNTLDRRIEDKFQQLVKQSEQEQRAKTNAMFQGFALQLQSVNSSDLYTAESLLEEALDLYPDLPGSRRQLALRFYSATEEAYMTKIIPPSTTESLRQRAGALAVWNHQMVCQNFNPAPAGSYPHEAEKWLERARDNGEDRDGGLSVCLAKLYGMRGRFDSMLKSLGMAKDKLHKATSEEMLRLICACGVACQTEEQLAELSKVLSRSLPLSEDSVFTEVDAFQGNLSRSFVAFIGRRKPNSFSGFNTPDVFQLRIHPIGENEFQLAFVGDQPHEIQWWPKRDGEQGQTQYLSKNEAWTVVNSHCWVLEKVEV